MGCESARRLLMKQATLSFYFLLFSAAFRLLPFGLLAGLATSSSSRNRVTEFDSSYNNQAPGLLV